jgi:hypothetical protein
LYKNIELKKDTTNENKYEILWRVEIVIQRKHF